MEFIKTRMRSRSWPRGEGRRQRDEEEQGDRQGDARDNGEDRDRQQEEDDFEKDKYEDDKTPPYEKDLFRAMAKSPQARKRLYYINELYKESQKDQIDFEQLDSKVKKLVNEYVSGSQLNDDLRDLTTNVTNLKINHNNAKLSSQIKPPSCLIPDNLFERPGNSLDRVAKLSRVFSLVPSFDVTKDLNIADFLTMCNSHVSDLRCELSVSEFKNMVLAKLSPKTRALVVSHIKGGNDQAGLQELYNYLINLYGSTEDQVTAWQKLTSDGPTYSSLRELLEDIVRLLNIAKVPEQEKVHLLMNNLRKAIEPHVYDRLLDWVWSCERIDGRQVEMSQLLEYLNRYKERIEVSMIKKSKRGKVYTVVTEKGRTQDVCTKCNRSGHDQSQCFSDIVCKRCNIKGHIARFCQKDLVCSNCGKPNHIKENCRARSNEKCRLCNGNHATVTCEKYKHEQPVRQPCKICLEQKNMRLYHPMSKCFLAKNNSNTKN